MISRGRFFGKGVFRSGSFADVMVRHSDMCCNGFDGSAMAEGVWEYVNSLVKSYRTQDEEDDEEDVCQYKVRLFLICG